MKKNWIILLVVAVVTGVVAWLYITRSKKSFDDTYADFAVADTAAIDKIFIADNNGKSVLLERKGTAWMIGDSMRARPQAVTLILRAIRDAKIQSPIAESARANTLKRLATTHRKVEIYQGGDEPVKTWYIGSHTQDLYGTFMLLELEDGDRSDIPYVVELPWHRGFLTPMFFTEAEEWRFTTIFEYPEVDFKKVILKNNLTPQESFTIENNGPTDIRLLDAFSKPVPTFDTLFARDYLNHFKAIHFEAIDRTTPAAEKDSILKSTPAYELTVIDKNGKPTTVKVFNKLMPLRDDEEMVPGIPRPLDENRKFGWIDNRYFAFIQNYTFDKLLINRSSFLK